LGRRLGFVNSAFSMTCRSIKTSHNLYLLFIDAPTASV